MKKVWILLLLVMCCVVSAAGVNAQSSITKLDGQWIVSENGQCDVSVTVSLTFDEAVAEPVFPIPAEASDITLNGEKINASSGQVKTVSLRSVTGGNAGEFTFNLHYQLPGVVNPGAEGMELTLDLLSGFAYPVDNMDFTVILPAPLTAQPVFSSSYYQDMIQGQMSVFTDSDTINGTTGPLKDHESLVLRLPVTEQMFPQPAVAARVMGVIHLAVLAAVVLAVVYFLITMLPRFLRHKDRVTPPDGVSAGDLQMWLTGRGIDLSLLVVTWAQLGYLRIQVDDGGRVLLHKRMDMGNERSPFEIRAFRNLFGRRRIVDGTGYHYAHLCRSMWGQTPGIREVYGRFSGNPKIFRGLCSIAGMLGGVVMAGGFLPHSVGLKIILAIACGIASLFIQSGGAQLPTRYKSMLPVAGFFAAAWLIAGFLSKEAAVCAALIVFEFLAGLASAYGGRRTAAGHQTMEQIFALRRFMRSGSHGELERLTEGNEGYFYQMAPYALAMDVDRAFARHFAGMELPECSYLIIGNRRQMSAMEWARQLRLTVQILDQKARRLPLERLTQR